MRESFWAALAKMNYLSNIFLSKTLETAEEQKKKKPKAISYHASSSPEM